LLRGIYVWTMAQAQRPYALWSLLLIAFIESSIFPIPPDVLLMPVVLAQRERAFRIALLCTLASVLGGLLGYAIGALLFETVGARIIEFYGYQSQFVRLQSVYEAYGAWIVFMAGVTPFPYKVITIASGVFQLDLTIFMLASFLSRGLRFGAVAALLWYFGPPIQAFIERNLGWLSVLFFVLLAGGFAILKLL
jgi:membrane protein YqaA with SNARE-associated domain